jgi:hypothetical protein
MTIRITKLDGRHTGFGYFSHYVEPSGNPEQRLQQMHEWRIWCWETFGPGIERDTALRRPFRNQVKWAWETHHNYRLFLTPELTTAFTLKWR